MVAATLISIALNISAYLINFGDGILCVIKGSNFFKANSVDNDHSLQAHGLHGRLARKQEMVVQVIEILSPK